MTFSLYHTSARLLRQTAILLASLMLLNATALAADDTDNATVMHDRATGKTFTILRLAPDTEQVDLEIYYRAVKEKIERVASCHFPMKDGKKLYGTLWMVIPIAEDGSISQVPDGLKITQSSGNAELDHAAAEIIRHAAPFAPLPTTLLTPHSATIFEMHVRLAFTDIDDDIKDCSHG